MSLVKSEKEIEIMRQAGRIWAQVMDELEQMCKPGVTTKEIDIAAERSIKEKGGIPGFLGYKPAWADAAYPATICASVNESIVHGIPNDYRLKNGDLLTIDMGVKLEGYNVDAAKTFVVGTTTNKNYQLLEATKLALQRALAVARAGNTLGDVGHTIEQTAKEFDLTVVKGLTGHGIGQKLHEEPTVFNEGIPGKGVELKEGMTLAIEPMFSRGSANIVQIPSDESYATQDASMSAHFEHTVVIRSDKAEILTAV